MDSSDNKNDLTGLSEKTMDADTRFLIIDHNTQEFLIMKVRTQDFLWIKE